MLPHRLIPSQRFSYPLESEGMFLPALVCMSVCVSVCLSVTMITKTIVDGFVQNFMGRFLGEREDHVCDSLRSVEGCGSDGQKTPAIVYILHWHAESYQRTVT